MATVMEFGAEEEGVSRNSLRLKRPIIVVSHLAFRTLALLTYYFSGFVSDGFIVRFLLVLTFLSLDFWCVKNVSGRLLVGLRWWNFVDAEGTSHWKFEARKDQSKIHQQEANIFWLALFLCPAVWLFAVFMAFFTFALKWSVVALIGFFMSGANLYGFVRCKWGTSEKISSFLTGKLFSVMLSRATKQQHQGTTTEM